MHNQVIVLGLDQSLTNTGWSIFCLNKLSSVLTFPHAGTIRTKPHQELNERLFHIESSVNHLIKTFNPDLICMEVVFIKRGSAGDFVNLIKVETTLQNYFYRCSLAYECIESLRNRKHSWRKLFNLTSDKSQSKALLMQTSLTLPKLNEHNADSALIALTGLVKNEYLNQEELFSLLGLEHDRLGLTA